MRVNLRDVLVPETEIARNQARRGERQSECVICRRPLKRDSGHWVEMLVDLTFLIDEEPLEGDVESQGAQHVGPDCFKRLRRQAS